MTKGKAGRTLFLGLFVIALFLSIGCSADKNSSDPEEDDRLVWDQGNWDQSNWE